MRTLLTVAVAFVATFGAGSSLADIALTDNCQEDVRILETEMEENKDSYTAESRMQANKEIVSAKTNLVNPVKCRKNLLQAREALRKGKRDKKKRDKDDN